jgi:hypothetical protein
MAYRRLILRDHTVPLSNNMAQEITSAINRALVQQKALAHITIFNGKRNANGAITAITHPNVTAEWVLLYSNNIMTAASTVDKGVVDFEESEFRETIPIHTVPLI